MQAELDTYIHISLPGKSTDHNMETTNKQFEIVTKLKHSRRE
jgi:hypothetical protein